MDIPNKLIGVQIQMVWHSNSEHATRIHILTDDNRKLSNLSIVIYYEYIETGNSTPSALLIIVYNSKDYDIHLLWWVADNNRPELKKTVLDWSNEFNLVTPHKICKLSIGSEAVF